MRYAVVKEKQKNAMWMRPWVRSPATETNHEHTLSANEYEEEPRALTDLFGKDQHAIGGKRHVRSGLGVRIVRCWRFWRCRTRPLFCLRHGPGPVPLKSS